MISFDFCNLLRISGLCCLFAKGTRFASLIGATGMIRSRFLRQDAARLESLLAKKWDKLKPKVVLIPAQRGCEKKVWFNLDKDIKAVLIQKDGME